MCNCLDAESAKCFLNDTYRLARNNFSAEFSLITFTLILPIDVYVNLNMHNENYEISSLSPQSASEIIVMPFLFTQHNILGHFWFVFRANRIN